MDGRERAVAAGRWRVKEALLDEEIDEPATVHRLPAQGALPRPDEGRNPFLVVLWRLCGCHARNHQRCHDQGNAARENDLSCHP